MEVSTTARKAVALLLTATIAVGVSAQIKLKPNGMAVIGSEPAGAAADSVSTLKIYGKSGSQEGGIISFGNGSLSTPDVLVGEYGNTGSGELWLHGKTGMKYTTADDKIIMSHGCTASGTHNFTFNSHVTVNGTLKALAPGNDGIRDPIIINPLDILSDIAPEETASAMAQGTVSSRSCDLDLEELEAIFPGSVYVDGNGRTYVDYIRLIPVLVNAINELKMQLGQVTGGSGMIITPLSTGATASSQDVATDAITPKLYQNSPNPFNAETVIRYALPHDVASATLFIYDMQGTQIRRYELEGRGEGAVTVSASSLKAGMYIYALVADGKEMDTKRMILTR